MTEKLYLHDPYTVEFQAHVIELRSVEQGFGAVLDRTYFHPAGGGQPSDRGTLDNLPVIGLMETEDGDVVHIVESELSGSVVGKIDWETRFDYMQQHTGQHILSQAFRRVVDAPTTGWRLVSPAPNIDVACANLSRDDVSAIECLANRIVYQNRDVKAYYSDLATLDSLPLRKEPLTKYARDEGIRIVEVDGFEYIPCGGTHCTKTGEVGTIVVRDWSRRGDKTWHIDFVCGKRALADYRQSRELVRELRRTLSVQEDRISTRVDEILEELDDLQHSLDQTHDELLEYKAKAMVSSARSLGGGNVRLVTEVGVTEDIHRLRIIASKIVSFPNMFVVLGHTDDKASLIVARSKNLEYDASVIIRQVCDEFGGGGGGSAMLAQGGGFESGRIAQIIHRVEEIVKSTFD